VSFKVTNWVWSRSESRNGARLVMLALADRADDNGCAWPSIDDLAERTKLEPPRAVQKGITKLVELGELDVENGGGRHRSNRYRIVRNPEHLTGLLTRNPAHLTGYRPKKPRTLRPKPRTLKQKPRTLRHETPSKVHPNPLKNQQQNHQRTTPQPPHASPADELLAKWWEQYGRTTAQGKRSIRRSIDEALNNGIPAAELWQALDRIGDLSKPVTGGTLQFALSELRRPAAGADVIPLNGRRPSTTDQRVNDALALAAEFRALEEGPQQ
jgi:hypothetical protein